MRSNAVVFLLGVSAMGAWVSGLFFLRFWYESADRLFAYFGVAFGLLGTSFALLGLINPTAETRPYIYALRLLAFVLIIVATIDKNRRRHP
jgi:hypothetical protein